MADGAIAAIKQLNLKNLWATHCFGKHRKREKEENHR
jgi:hypothetical protein